MAAGSNVLLNTLAIGGFGNAYGSVIATAGVAEKGQLTVRVEATSPGGHSSMPPDHTVR